MKINFKENLICKNTLYEKDFENEIILVSNVFEFEIKKINKIDWTIVFFYTKKFHLNKLKTLVLEFQSITLIHISNDDNKFDYSLLKEILDEHEIENNSIIKRVYFSKVKDTDHLFYSFLDNEMTLESNNMGKMIFDSAIEKGIKLTV